MDRAKAFTGTMLESPMVLTEGSVIERLRRDPEVSLHPEVLHALFSSSRTGRTALEKIYREYLDIGLDYNLPMLLYTPTWRADPERLADAGAPDVGAVSEQCARFVAGVRAQYCDYARKVFVGGLMGCRGDAYKAEEALSTDEAIEFHFPQIKSLAESGVDFLIAQTLPAFSEALGIALLMAESQKPYVLSFIVRPSGKLLDGCCLSDAIRMIDNAVDRKPAFYMLNCLHPEAAEEALEKESLQSPETVRRVEAFQGNTSPKSPEDLDGLDYLDSQDPESFAVSVHRLRSRFGIRILGGCCGTDEKHIREIARQAKPN